MKSRILCFIAGFLFLSLVSQDLLAQGYKEVTIRELNAYEELPQVTNDFREHPLVGEAVEFTAIVVSNPRTSGLSNFEPEDAGDDGVEISRIHFFVIDTTAYSQGKEGMYMHVVTTDVGSFETLERGDMITMRGTHSFFGNTVQLAPDNADFITNILLGGDLNPDARFKDLLEPITLSANEINQFADEEGGTFRFRPEAYPDYINAYIRLEGQEVIGSELDDTGRPNFYWVDEQGIAMQYRDISLRFRNDRNDEQGGYREGYNYRRVEEDGPFRPPSSGSIVNISGFVVWDTFDGAFGINESAQEGALQLSPMEDGVLWWLGERTFVDPNSGEPWPNDLEVLGFPPVIANYELSTAEPAAGEAVTVTASITGPEGEEVDEVIITYNSTRGHSETNPMADEGDGKFSYEFPVFDDFTAVSFVIEATSEAELVTGEIIPITARFTDGSLDVAGDVLEMEFVYLGDVITDIETVQRTMDGTRGPSPFQGYEDIGLNIDVVVVSGAEDGFVIVHDGNQAWSGVPLASTNNVPQLQRGQMITITGGSIANSFDNVYLDDVTFTANGTVDDLDDYIPTITTSEARLNSGRAYEGMLVRLENVEVQTSQADAPQSDFGEWALIPQDDPEGRILRVRNRLSFAAVTEGLDSNIPNDLNAHMRVGAELDAIYGFMAHSFGNPKIQLRTLNDIVSDEGFTWPVRDIDLFSFHSESATGSTAIDSDTVRTDQNNIAEWDFSTSYDDKPFTYRFALDVSGGDFSDPILSVQSEADGTLPEVTITSAELEAALGDLLAADESMVFNWTVFLVAEDGEEVQVSVKDGPVFTPTYREVLIQGSEVTSGELEDELPRTMELRQNYPNPFNPTTVIEFTVPEDTDVRLSVYDVLGRQVSLLVNEHKSAGSYEVNFDATRLASGVYIYRLEAGDTFRTKRMMLVK